MTSLDDAWAWYQAARRSARIVLRLATKHWDALPPDKSLDSDRRSIIEAAERAVDPLDDLAVVVLFSVFEAVVREHLLEGMTADEQLLTNAILKDAAREARKGVEVGSFYHRVLGPLKTADLNDLIEQVNQIRNYRNWVAHGRRSAKATTSIDPQTAYDRLKAFLNAIAAN